VTTERQKQSEHATDRVLAWFNSLCCFAALLLCCFAALLLCCFAALLLCCSAALLTAESWRLTALELSP
jgi:hypothetical protein